MRSNWRQTSCWVESMVNIPNPCSPSCPRRRLRCHNPKTCPAWAEYLMRKKEAEDAAHKRNEKQCVIIGYKTNRYKRTYKTGGR